MLLNLPIICLNRYLRQLNIDKEIMSMKNFNIYDPMKKGQGLTLDGQTLAHLEVTIFFSSTYIYLMRGLDPA